MKSKYDIAIIGGGPVGASLALALRDSNLDICVLEARSKTQDITADPRALALSYGSRLLLDRLGVWNELAQVTAIRTIHISQKHSFGRAVLRATELNVPELGYVLPYHALQCALQKALQAGNTTCFTGASVTQLQAGTDGAHITFQQDGNTRVLNARLVVVADGGKLLEATYPPKVHDYGQTAIITHVACSQPLFDTAFERFTVQGPIALLPYRDSYELVWTVPHDAVQSILEQDDATFLAQLQRHFGGRVGTFLSLGPRSCFPLRLKRAPQVTLPHAILLGNAAQTLHPVAGQGFNMGLRDAWELAQVTLRCLPETLGGEAMLARYKKLRHLDRNAGIGFTDGLVRLFSNDLPLLDSGRAVALTLFDCMPLAKRWVARRMMFGTNG